ncbi:MAG: hypothetical protein KJ579_01765 [Verrucomicrobia bacterium]|nr:hypothetical protein [Verrucomicrobiota bacterium]
MSDEAKPAGELDLNAIRGQLNLPEGAGEKEIIGALLQVIAAINAKYEQLLQDSVAVEEQVANRDLADFADVVPDEAKPFWTEQLLANRETTLAILTGLRAAKSTPPPSGSPPSDLGPRTSALDPARSAPLRNRLPAAAPRPVADLANPAPGADDARAVAIRNRAHEIRNREGVPFVIAFARAEREIPETR